MPKATFYIPKGLLLQATKAVFTCKFADAERPAKCKALACKALAQTCKNTGYLDKSRINEERRRYYGVKRKTDTAARYRFLTKRQPIYSFSRMATYFT